MANVKMVIQNTIHIYVFTCIDVCLWWCVCASLRYSSKKQFVFASNTIQFGPDPSELSMRMRSFKLGINLSNLMRYLWQDGQRHDADMTS